MKKIREIPLLDRPREKLSSKGPKALSDTELIAVIINRGIPGRDALQVAAEISEKIKNNNFTHEELKEIQGVGATKACQILAAFELARRHLQKNETKITSPKDVIPLLADIVNKKQEHFICITLNGANEIVGNRVITVGILNASLVHPREVFADAITDRAASIILAHNHPSGSLNASREDLSITKQLVEAGEILGIKVTDHLIVSKKGYLSMKEEGLI